MALDLTPSDRELCSQPTISRLENLPDARALLRMGRAMVDLYCESYSKVPKRAASDEAGHRLNEPAPSEQQKESCGKPPV
jgi:hypothetical protein